MSKNKRHSIILPKIIKMAGHQMDIDDFLKNSDTFSSLNESERKQVASCFNKIELTKNEILFRQGDLSDNIYILMEGNLSAELINAEGEITIIGYVGAGETVGEMGALSNEPRSLTIKAINNATLLKITAHDFIDIGNKYPSIMFAVMRHMISRTSSIIQTISAEKRDKHIIIVPANASISMHAIFSKLNELTKTYVSTLIISDEDEDFSDKNDNEFTINEKIKKRVNTLKYIHRTVYIVKEFNTPLAKKALALSTVMYVVCEGNTKANIDTHLLDIISNRRQHLKINPHLILLYSDHHAIPENTLDWLKLTDFGLHHHIRLNAKNDFLRLFRFIRGKAVGLILGGGGTRGWAHIGAIKALKEEKIPIDIIGGTSVGALVAGIYAMNPSYKKVYKQFLELVIQSKNTISWRSLTWPIISLFNAKKYTKAQMDLFQNKCIEDAWIPYFCITSNLAECTEEMHQTGLLWEKIRASTAIPGLIPPMILNNQIHIDGGLFNNLPVDVMRKMIGVRGKVIAIELNDLEKDETKYQFSPIQSFKDILLRKLKLKKNNEKYPKLIDTFLRSLLLGSLWRTRQNASMANLFVSLNLSHFQMLHSNPEEGDKLVTIGFEETIKQIKRMKNKNTTPG